MPLYTAFTERERRRREQIMKSSSSNDVKFSIMLIDIMLRSNSTMDDNTNYSLWTSTMLKNCSTPQNFASAFDMLKCYRLLYTLRWELNTAEILLALLIVAFNSLVVVLLATKKKQQTTTKISIFDKLMIAHCIVDGLTGLLDVPFFHFNHVLGFWPFGTPFSLAWTSFDNGINVITNLHMLYMTWIRFRSIRAPNTYEKEILSQYPLYVSIGIWLLGLCIWIPITFSYGVADFSTNINFKPVWVEVLLIFITWFSPLIAIIVLAAFILMILNERNKRVAHMKRASLPSMVTHTTAAFPAARSDPAVDNDGASTTMAATAATASASIKSKWRRSQLARKIRSHMRLGPQIRFEIIILSYWLQWFPSCLMAVVDPLCMCVPSSLSATVYWLTYTVCLTDPLVILIFNPNVSLKNRKSSVI